MDKRPITEEETGLVAAVSGAFGKVTAKPNIKPTDNPSKGL
ncbi:hypothetical protein MP33_16775 [Escherichia coli N37058PS]|nr:hypothetical protein MP33_16775 [Escherichia coli N37058PS]